MEVQRLKKNILQSNIFTSAIQAFLLTDSLLNVINKVMLQN